MYYFDSSIEINFKNLTQNFIILYIAYIYSDRIGDFSLKTFILL